MREACDTTSAGTRHTFGSFGSYIGWTSFPRGGRFHAEESLAMSSTFVHNAVAFTAPPATIKKRATADEIQVDLQERIDRLAARDEKFRGCTASRPRPSHARMHGAPNWTVDGFPGLP